MKSMFDEGLKPILDVFAPIRQKETIVMPKVDSKREWKLRGIDFLVDDIPEERLLEIGNDFWKRLSELFPEREFTQDAKDRLEGLKVELAQKYEMSPDLLTGIVNRFLKIYATLDKQFRNPDDFSREERISYNEYYNMQNRGIYGSFCADLARTMIYLKVYQLPIHPELLEDVRGIEKRELALRIENKEAEKKQVFEGSEGQKDVIDKEGIYRGIVFFVDSIVKNEWLTRRSSEEEFAKGDMRMINIYRGMTKMAIEMDEAERNVGSVTKETVIRIGKQFISQLENTVAEIQNLNETEDVENEVRSKFIKLTQKERGTHFTYPNWRAVIKRYLREYYMPEYKGKKREQMSEEEKTADSEHFQKSKRLIDVMADGNLEWALLYTKILNYPLHPKAVKQVRQRMAEAR